MRKELRVRRLLFIAFLIMIAGCSGSPTESPPPDPTQLITEAANNIRTSQTFRMDVDRTGAPYRVETGLGSVIFRRAVAQYVAPDILQATVRLIAAGLPADVDIFSRGDEQWYRNAILTANTWLNAPFAIGFNPRTLIAEDTGFKAALNSLIDLTYVDEENMADGTPVFHLKGTAKGEDIAALLAGMIQATGNVLVDVYIDQAQRIPVRFIIVQPDTVTETEPEPTTWTVDVYDINAEPDIDEPGVS
jgi:hypothetical protein